MFSRTAGPAERAALAHEPAAAPADPSGQDRAVAASAAQMEARAQAGLGREQAGGLAGQDGVDGDDTAAAGVGAATVGDAAGTAETEEGGRSGSDASGGVSGGVGRRSEAPGRTRTP